MSELTVLIDPTTTSTSDLVAELAALAGVTVRFADGPIIDIAADDAAMASVRALVEAFGGSIHGIAEPKLMEPIDPWTAIESSRRR